jgi:hypothetical protein
MNTNSQDPFRDPFEEIQAQLEGEWAREMLAHHEWFDTPAASSPATIRTWDEIPNIFTLDVPPTEWMVEGILPRASVTLIAGEPGSYKTWLALALLRGVATGGNFLGRKCAQANVLYLDRENPLAVMRERLAVLGVERSAAADCRIWSGWLADAPPGIGDIRILEIARVLRPLIVFDSLIRFHAAADENSATAMSMVMADLRALANAGATVVALHHKPKSEGAHYRGSSDIAGGVDTAWAVSRDRDAGLLRLECFKSRFTEEFSLTVRPELGGTGDFVVTDSAEAATEQTDIEKLAEAIRRNPGQPKERVIQASGVRRGRGRTLLEEFEGQLWQVKHGPGKSRRFFPVGVSPMALSLDDISN